MNTTGYCSVAFPGFPVLAQAEKQNRDAGNRCGTMGSRFSRFSRSMFRGARVAAVAGWWRGGGSYRAALTEQVDSRMVTGPGWGLCTRGLRAPIYLVWMRAEHSEQVHDFKYVSALKTHAIGDNKDRGHRLLKGSVFSLPEIFQVAVHAATFTVPAPGYFLTGKTGITGNPLCRNGFRHPGFVFRPEPKPGNREKILFFARRVSPPCRPTPAAAIGKTAPFSRDGEAFFGPVLGWVLKNRESSYQTLARHSNE